MFNGANQPKASLWNSKKYQWALQMSMTKMTIKMVDFSRKTQIFYHSLHSSKNILLLKLDEGKFWSYWYFFRLMFEFGYIQRKNIEIHLIEIVLISFLLSSFSYFKYLESLHVTWVTSFHFRIYCFASSSRLVWVTNLIKTDFYFLWYLSSFIFIL